MAARFDASTDNLNRTTNLPAIATTTLMAWASCAALITGTGLFQGAISLGATPITGNFMAVGQGGSAGNIARPAVYNGSTVVVGTSIVATNIWNHYALTCAGTGANLLKGYYNSVNEITTTAAAAITSTRIIVGDDAGGDPMNARIAAIKIWNAVLTQQEIQTEMRCYQPVRVANLLSWHPMLLHTDVAQYGTTWTVGGTLATEQGPPIAWSLRPSMPRLRALVAVTGGARQTAWVIGQAVPRASAF